MSADCSLFRACSASEMSASTSRRTSDVLILASAAGDVRSAVNIVKTHPNRASRSGVSCRRSGTLVGPTRVNLRGEDDEISARQEIRAAVE